MSRTTDTSTRSIRGESPTVDAVCRLIEREAPPEDKELALRFSELFFAKAPADFLAQRSTDALARLVLGAFRFLKEGSPDEVDVEVFNPDVDNEGWYAPVTVIRTNISERPFVVDSLREFLHSQDLGIEQYIYPVLHVVRGEDGELLEVRASLEGETRESLVHCEIARVTGEATREFLKGEIAHRLQDVVNATSDFEPMIDALNDTVAHLAEVIEHQPERREEIREIQEFLKWLRDGAFVFLGYRGYDVIDNPADGKRAITVERGSGLGILKNESQSSYYVPVIIEDMPAVFQAIVEGGPMLIISKTNAESTVHRRARMDYIGIKKLDKAGRVVGERRFVGLFTSRAYAEDSDRTPILRQKLRRILDESGVSAGSHDYKEINTVFNSMPKEELFLASAEEIAADVRTVLTTHQTNEVRVGVREDPLGRGVSFMVIIPKDRFSGEIRKAVEEAFVDLYQGEVLNYHLALGEGDQARLHFYLAVPQERLQAVQTEDLETLVAGLIRSWSDRVQGGLERVRPQDEARRLARRYGSTFSAEYQAATEPEIAVKDILEIEAMRADGRLVAISLSNADNTPAAAAAGEPVTELKLYLSHDRLILSDFMPILENAGLRVLAVNPFEIQGAGVPDAVIYSFAVQDSERNPIDVDSRGTLLSETILAVRGGDASNDGLNSLVLSAGLAWREVEVLRAYASYGFQIGAVPSRISLPTALRKYPDIAQLLFQMFEVRFNPEGVASLDERRGECAQQREQFLAMLADVSLLADDRALRRLETLVGATQRTNYYQNGGRVPMRRSGGVPYVSLKFAVRRMESIARSKLLYEVWVRSPRMEGVHLRGATVARGGIRYSDRPDDFRTEVMGLVKTQMVKNAVIVPAGSKGGFVTLRQLDTREAMAEEAKEQYKTLIRGLLDITDNLDASGNPIPPRDVMSYDDPDPYLVVAADKGTATYSDMANGIAAEYDFWLGDAFASGGSNGYDHKVVGITARGGWEGVKRHFREKGKDIQTEPFTVVGIGDMSGDVFGNGMLLSEQIRLVAAFDHRHIFIDPDPDPATSFQERRRLFEMGRSSWADYDESLLSEGGMIIPRGSKTVALSPQALLALGVEQPEGTIDGETLIRMVLRAPVELLWNGGIGTYVKASHEHHADAGDPGNEAVRVDANELRAQVLGEGGNLGFTQEARIEYATLGGRLNTDALDNSGGVDLSDREVNLKILFNRCVAAGSMDLERRNTLLEQLQDAVAKLVLRDNESQSLAISLDEIRGQDGVDELRDLISALEKANFFDRADEHLPTWEKLQARMEEGSTITRPELCVLLAYSKLHLMSRLLKSSLLDDLATEAYLLGYFPPMAVMEAGDEHLNGHRLRREIIASQLTNDVTDLMGSSFIMRVTRDTGRSPAEVARAWLVAARLAGHRALLAGLRGGDGEAGPPTEVTYRWLLGLARVLERAARWILANVEPGVPTSQIIEDNLDGLATLRDAFGELVTGEDRRLFEERVLEIQGLGTNETFARGLITLRFLDQLLEILRVARESESDPVESAHAYYGVSDVLRLPWLRERIFACARDDRWEQRAAQLLADDLTRAHHRLAASVVSRLEEGEEVGRVARRVIETRGRGLDRIEELLDEVASDEEISLAGLSVAVWEISKLAKTVNGGH